MFHVNNALVVGDTGMRSVCTQHIIEKVKASPPAGIPALYVSQELETTSDGKI